MKLSPKWLRAAIGAAALLIGPAAHADQLVIQRNVTVREEPRRASEALQFPPVGTILDILDEGARRSGYYHVRLPDGRDGWVYQTFVRRLPEQPASALIAAPQGDRVAVHFINVDQGAAALLEFPCGAILIDAGGRTEADGDHLIEYLRAFFARRSELDERLDAVFVTHTHVDHNSNLMRVAEEFEVGGYIHNGRLIGSGRRNARSMIQHSAQASPVIPALALTDISTQGVTGPVIDPLACPRVDPRIRVFSGGLTANPSWPVSHYENGNNHSLVIRVDYGDAAFLFTGDLEDHAIERLIDRHGSDNPIDVDVYVVGHHGSYNGTTPSLLARTSPDFAIISMGRHTIQREWTAWRHGHPRRTLVQLLDGSISMPRAAAVDVMVADGVKRFSTYRLTDSIYATGWDGDIIVSATADGQFQVSTNRQP